MRRNTKQLAASVTGGDQFPAFHMREGVDFNLHPWGPLPTTGLKPEASEMVLRPVKDHKGPLNFFYLQLTTERWRLIRNVMWAQNTKLINAPEHLDGLLDLGRIGLLLEGKMVFFEDHVTAERLGLVIHHQTLGELRVWLDQLLELGWLTRGPENLAGLGAVISTRHSPKSSYITLKKVRVGWDESYRRRYGSRATWRKVSFSFAQEWGLGGQQYVPVFRIDNLGWYVTSHLLPRLHRLAAGEEVMLVNNSRTYKLEEEDRAPFTVWLDQLVQDGFFS